MKECTAGNVAVAAGRKSIRQQLVLANRLPFDRLAALVGKACFAPAGKRDVATGRRKGAPARSCMVHGPGRAVMGRHGRRPT